GLGPAGAGQSRRFHHVGAGTATAAAAGSPAEAVHGVLSLLDPGLAADDALRAELVSALGER
ncbi:hypothetical protein AB0F81_41425, partial [Actinoplanes sp. NPDC024001]|uniref:hypothetical protein n=1 Tax=Actinoplanes sp. NPDC024001 TaxID=3154598 RepID=UPI0033D47FC6